MAISFLTITKSGSGSGTVTSDVGSVPGPINCGATCSDTQTNGNTVTLTATPARGSVFVRWSGGVNSTSNPVSYVQSSNITINAEFRRANRGSTGANSNLFVRLDYNQIQGDIEPFFSLNGLTYFLYYNNGNYFYYARGIKIRNSIMGSALRATPKTDLITKTNNWVIERLDNGDQLCCYAISENGKYVSSIKCVNQR